MFNTHFHALPVWLPDVARLAPLFEQRTATSLGLAFGRFECPRDPKHRRSVLGVGAVQK